MAELHALLGQMTEQGKVIGGGSDLIIRMNMGLCEPDALLFPGRVPVLRQIRAEADFVEIGAAATMAELARSALLQGKLEAIAHAAADVGSTQIRNNATIGGNLANASPAGDLIPILFLLEARVVIASPEGLRTLPVEEVVTGPSRTCLRHNEAIVAIRVPVPPSPGYRSAFCKLGFRKAVTISRIGLAVGLDTADGIVRDARVVVGAISLTPLRLPRAEELLRGAAMDSLPSAAVGEALSDLILEVTPEMFDRDYKIRAARGIVEDVFRRLAIR